MASIKLQGDTSGEITISAPAVAGTNTLTLPASSGTIVTDTGAQTIQFSAGTAAAPSVTTTGDTNTGIFFPAADTIAFAEGGAEAMRINSSGELLMNGQYGGYDSNSTGAITLNANASDGTVNFKKGIVFSSDGGAPQNVWAHAGITSTGSAGFNGNLLFGTDGTGTQSGTITERMRVRSNGYLSIGCTSSPNASTIGVEFVPVLTSDWCKFSAGSTGGIRTIGFYNPNGLVGDITTNGSGTLFNTSSDYRLKENNVNITDGISRVKLLKPYRFNFIADASVTVDGFFAHEVQGVVPEAITKTKDAMRTEEYEVTPAVLDDDGNVVTEAVMGTREVPDYQGIDQSKLVPLLTAALQEAIQRIEALEAK
jgi:hypothetical protein